MATSKTEERDFRPLGSGAGKTAGNPCRDDTPRDLLRLVALPSLDDTPGSPSNPSLGSLELDSLEGKSPDHLISAKELSRYLQVPVSWCWRASRQGLLPHYRCGQYLRYDLAEVLNSLRRAGWNRDRQG